MAERRSKHVMPNWDVIAGIAATFASLGILADSLLLRRQRGRLYQALLRGFLWLDDRTAPELPQQLAGQTTRFLDYVAGSKLLSVRSIAVSAFASVLLTVSFLAAGFLAFAALGTNVVIPFAIAILAVLVPLGVFLDFVSINIFRWATKSVAHRGVMGAWWQITLSALVTLAFAVLSLTVSFRWLDSVMDAEEYWNFYRPAAALLFTSSSLSMFLPVVTFFLCLVALWAVKSVLSAARLVGLHIIEVATEEEEAKLKIFTLVGGLFGFISVLAKTISSVNAWLAQPNV